MVDKCVDKGGRTRYNSIILVVRSTAMYNTMPKYCISYKTAAFSFFLPCRRDMSELVSMFRICTCTFHDSHN